MNTWELLWLGLGWTALALLALAALIFAVALIVGVVKALGSGVRSTKTTQIIENEKAGGEPW